MRQGSAMVQQAAEPRTEVLWVEEAVRGRTTENRLFHDDPKGTGCGLLPSPWKGGRLARRFITATGVGAPDEEARSMPG
jgi:hypothetical protein